MGDKNEQIGLLNRLNNRVNRGMDVRSMKHLKLGLVASIVFVFTLVVPLCASSEEGPIDQLFDVMLANEVRDVTPQMTSLSDHDSSGWVKGQPLSIGVRPIPVEVSVDGGQVIARDDGTFVVINPEGPLRVYRATPLPCTRISVNNGQVILRKDRSIVILRPGQPPRELSTDESVDIYLSGGQIIIEEPQEQIVVQSDGTISVISPYMGLSLADEYIRRR
jgi:hypothetical protein